MLLVTSKTKKNKKWHVYKRNLKKLAREKLEPEESEK